jgi:hypothetical protein
MSNSSALMPSLPRFPGATALIQINRVRRRPDRFGDSGRIRFAEDFAPDDRLAAGLQDEITLAKLTPSTAPY